MPKYLIILCLSCFFVATLSAQKKTENTDAYEKAYQKRIKKEAIHGVYIPKDLTDAFLELNRLTDKKSKAMFKNASEVEAVRKLHFSLGRWIIYNWGFYEGSRLSHHLKQLGIHHPDDMATFIILSYHRNLNRKSLNVKEQIEQIQEKQKRAREHRLKEGTILHEEKRVRSNKPH